MILTVFINPLDLWQHNYNLCNREIDVVKYFLLKSQNHYQELSVLVILSVFLLCPNNSSPSDRRHTALYSRIRLFWVVTVRRLTYKFPRPSPVQVPESVGDSVVIPRVEVRSPGSRVPAPRVRDSSFRLPWPWDPKFSTSSYWTVVLSPLSGRRRNRKVDPVSTNLPWTGVPSTYKGLRQSVNLPRAGITPV